jgi:hypothetical protein
MPDRFVTVGTYTLAYEAELARNLLETEGIAAIIDGDLTGGLLPTGEIQLQVAAEDAGRATGILAAQAAEASLAEDWEERAEAGVSTCSVCGEPVAEGTAVCHSCRTPRDAVRTATGRVSDAIQPPREQLATTPSPTPAPAQEQVPEEAEEPDAPTAAGDELARRALGAAAWTLVIVFVAPLAWWYLLRIVLHPGSLGPRGIRHFAWALALNSLIALTWIAWLLWIH